eukprot:2621822-Pleurochrysis_carterae.AAC.1
MVRSCRGSTAERPRRTCNPSNSCACHQPQPAATMTPSVWLCFKSPSQAKVQKRLYCKPDSTFLTASGNTFNTPVETVRTPSLRPIWCNELAFAS